MAIQTLMSKVNLDALDNFVLLLPSINMLQSVVDTFANPQQNFWSPLTKD